MDIVIIIILFVLLNLILYRFISYFCIIVSALIIVFIHLFLKYLFSEYLNDNLPEETLDLLSRRTDCILYRIFGEKFLDFRRKYEKQFESFYLRYDLALQKSSLFKVIFFLLVIAVSIPLLRFSEKMENGFLKNENKKNVRNETGNSKQNIQKQSDNRIKRNTLADSGIDDNKRDLSYEELMTAKRYIIKSFQDKYGEKWQEYLRKSIEFQRDNHYNNLRTRCFVDKNGYIDLNVE